jgi:hypothetical protein
VTVSLVLRVAAPKRHEIDARTSLSASALVNHSIVHRIREHYPTTQLQHCRRAPIGKTTVSGEIARSAARQPVYSASATVLVYIIIVTARLGSALPLCVPLHCTCGICRAPRHISPNSYSSLPRMSQIEKSVQTSHAALEESPPDRLESVYFAATYQTYGLKS